MKQSIPIFVYIDANQPLEEVRQVIEELGGKLLEDLYDPKTDDSVICTVPPEQADELRRRLRCPTPMRATIAAA